MVKARVNFAFTPGLIATFEPGTSRPLKARIGLLNDCSNLNAMICFSVCSPHEIARQMRGMQGAVVGNDSETVDQAYLAHEMAEWLPKTRDRLFVPSYSGAMRDPLGMTSK